MQQVYPFHYRTFSRKNLGLGLTSPTMETALLRQKVELLERIIQGIENERNDLRRRRNPPLDPDVYSLAN